MRHFTTFPLVLVAACKMSEPEIKTDPPAVVKAPAAHAAPEAKPVGAVGPLKLGEPVGPPTVTLGSLVKDPKPYENKVVSTEGTVIAVCKQMGCWMEMKDASGEAHIKMAGHSFFVPKNASGRTARVKGKVLKTDPEEECAQEATEQLKRPVAKVQLEATGIELD